VIRTRQLVSLCFFLLLVTPLKAATLSVVYPKMNAPHNQIFDQIIDGIEDEFDGKVQLIPVPRKYKAKEIAEIAIKVQSQKPDMVITLARAGFKVAQKLKGQYPLVSGALPIGPNGIAGISPVADPLVMFNHLKGLAPSVKRIHVVYSERNQWLIDLAKQTAKTMKLELLAYKVENVKAATKQYLSLISSVDSKNDGFWLPPDGISAHEKLVLPMLLEAAWDKHFVLFSSRPAHAKRGALFSLMPDNRTLGSKLVKMVIGMHKQATNPGVQPTKQVKLAVNLRTASHLGLEYTTRQKGRFHLTFPTQ
jgi:putative ABC transport system substrate-binding protein